ncbi:hypothetical protein M0R19_06360 [Candidatus Pacearchaeota archaeon]|nr:hypothetical protein [Candidatus Pacearchaeota archaeon]
MAIEIKQVTKQVYLDGVDISDKVYRIEYNNSEDAPVKHITIYLRDKSIIYGKREYLRRDQEWTQTRIQLYLNSIFMGNFFWESTSFSTGIIGAEASISGRSAVAILDEPYSTQITTIFENLNSKKAVAETLCTSGITLSWLIPDSTLPASKYGTDKKTPLEIINDLVKACNGTLITYHDDTLVATYKEFTTEGKPSVATFDGKFDIIGLSEDRTIPEGKNEIRVQSYEGGTYEKNRPVVKLGLSKDSLKSDGADYLYATALCYKPSGELETLTLYEDESQQASDSSAFEISVSNPIAEVVGIWLDDGIGGHSTVVELGPDAYKKGETTIITSTFMPMNTDYLITYRGGRLCTFSQSTAYDVSVDISSPSVLIEDGSATTRVRSQDGGGGWVWIEAEFSSSGGGSANDYKLVTVQDPNVSGISLSANPSSLAITETADIMAKVTNSSGNPIYDGFTVTFSIIEGHGSLSANTATTLSTIVDNIKISGAGHTESRLSLPDIPSSISGLYLNSTKSGTNYISSIETVSGSTVILGVDVPLFPQGANIWATYVTGGLAKILFTAPSTMPSSLEDVTHILGMAGSEIDICEISINKSSTDNNNNNNDNSNNKDNNNYDHYYSEWQPIEFSGVFSGYSEADNPLKLKKYLPPLDNGYYEFSNNVCTNCSIYTDTIGVNTIVLCVVYGYFEETEQQDEKINPEVPQFTLKVFVKDSETDTGIAGASVTIWWPKTENAFDEETQFTSGNPGGMGVVEMGVDKGWATFKRAVPFTAEVECLAEGYESVNTSINGANYAPASVLEKIGGRTEGEVNGSWWTGEYATFEEYINVSSNSETIKNPVSIYYHGIVYVRVVVTQ